MKHFFDLYCQAYTIIVRQKAKLVYDCSLTLEFSTGEEKSLSEVEFNEINNHDLDVEFEINYNNSKKLYSDTIILVKKNKKAIENIIKELFLEFWESQKK